MTPAERKELYEGEKITDYYGQDWTIDKLLKGGRIRAHMIDEIGYYSMVIEPEDMETRFTVKGIG
jgi:hypothetical protein